MKHAEHGAKAKGRFNSPFMLFTSVRGSHASSNNRAAAVLANNGAVVSLENVDLENVNQEFAVSLSRRQLRLARVAKERKNRMIVSASLFALVGAALTSMTLNKPNSMDSLASKPYSSKLSFVDDSSAQAASRSSMRESINRANKYLNFSSAVAGLESDLSAFSTKSSHKSKWDLGSNSDFKVSEMSKSAANNPNVAVFLDSDAKIVPSGFNPNHDSGDSGNAYEFSQCTWWVYVRRHQLGLPVGSNMGDGWMWGWTARKLGYWVDNTPRHVGDIMVFGRGQAGVNRAYGHVAIVEKINQDGSIETSESSAEYHGRTYSRAVSAKDASAFEFIHY